jgi:hypothetical protein
VTGAQRIDPRTGLEQRVEYFGSPPDLKLGRSLGPSGQTLTGVLIAPSLSPSHREPANRLRTQMSRLGHTVFTFDYRGRGQSQGEALNLDLDTMISDTEEAVTWALGSVDGGLVGVVGMGVGCAPAVFAPPDGAPLVLWDPDLTGHLLLHDLAVSRVSREMGFEPDHPAQPLRDRLASDLVDAELGRQGFLDGPTWPTPAGLATSLQTGHGRSVDAGSNQEVLVVGDRSGAVGPIEVTVISDLDERETTIAGWLDTALQTSGTRR